MDFTRVDSIRAKSLGTVVTAFEDIVSNVQNTVLFGGKRTVVTSAQRALCACNFQNEQLQLVANVILDHCQKADRAGPSAFLPTLKLILFCLKFNESVPEIDESITSLVTRPTWNELKRLVDDDKVGAILLEAIALAGLEGKVFLDPNPFPKTFVEKTQGFCFKVSFPKEFQSGSAKDVRCVVVDGVVESVSEIHRLLHDASETHEPLLFACRGFADDVLQTIAVNNRRKTFLVVPATVRLDVDGANVLNDIAVACCTDVVSSLKGELISSISWDALTKVAEVSFDRNLLVIKNNNAIVSAQRQVSMLLEKHATLQSDILRKVIDDRIASLTPASVRIGVEGGRSFHMTLERLDFLLRWIRSCVRHGLLDGSRMRKEPYLQDLFAGFVSVETIASTFCYAKACLGVLREIETSLTLDSKCR